VSSVLYAIPTLGTRNDWLRVSVASVRRQAIDGLRTVVVAPSGSPAGEVAAALDVDHLASDRPGLSAAVNDVWRMLGDGYDYFGWIADDDALSPISLLAATEHHDRHPETVAVHGRWRELGPDGSTLHVLRPGRLAGALLPYGTQQVSQQGCLFRADAVRSVGYLDETLEYSMDYDLMLKLRHLGRLDYLPLELGAARVHPATITANRSDGGQELTTVRERSLTPRQALAYRRLRWAAVAADRVYASVLRRMPAEPPVRVGPVEYFHADAVTPR
jgi:GT2 family glycosyltransferase